MPKVGPVRHQANALMPRGARVGCSLLDADEMLIFESKSTFWEHFMSRRARAMLVRNEPSQLASGSRATQPRFWMTAVIGFNALIS
jgi:hypothetical protein